jgi:DNA polymerase elongation subunit (family B)
MCFIGCRKPKWSERDHYGSPEPVCTIYGRSHLDYKDLFEKFTFEGRESYALGNILAEEVGVGKLHYEGTLEELYHNAFPLFCAYNFRDVSGMVDLEGKFKFIQMVNQMAHENTCRFPDMLGTVRYVETGITNFAHTKKKVIVPDKRIMTDGDKVEGAIVLTPKIGLWEFLGSVDLVSLYPTEIMSANISPEMFIAQFVDAEEAWSAIMFGTTTEHVPVPEDEVYRANTDDGDFIEMSRVEWKAVLIEQKWCLTAYGTIFDQSRGMGLVPEVLSYWFAERKRLQGEKKKFGKLAREEQDPVKKAEYERQEEHFDLLQLTKKIQLNSTYGALLNAAFRFGRKEMGASVTACGRATTTQMMQVIHKHLEGTNRRLVKTTEVDKDGKVSHGYTIDSDVIIYGDTDSCYFRTKATNKADAIKIADEVAAVVNAGWPAFMVNAFNVQPDFNGRMKAGREVVAERGLFQAKKKYVLKVVDNEGVTPAGGYKLKSQGSEIKKSDTPKIIQGFLKDLMGRILSGDGYPEVEAFVNVQRKALLGKDGDIFSMGVAKQANNLDEYYAAWVRAGRPIAGKVMLPSEMNRDGYAGTAVPGQVRAAIHYNEIVKEKEQGAKLVRGGDKVRVFYLKPNHHRWKSIGIPAELERFPDWFDDEFAVDKRLTEEKMFDNKLKGIFSAIGWEVPTPQNTLINSILKF